MEGPLHRLTHWSPFHLDALGLVTLLGAEEVSTAVGALEHSRYSECLPLFGTYLIAGNKFTRPIPGFALYNISDGVYVPILNGWFSRWLIAHLTAQVTILQWEIAPKKRNFWAKELFALVLGFMANGALITLAVLQGDSYGLANALAMALSVIIRRVMVHENRKHLNQILDGYMKNETPFLEPEHKDNLIQRGLVQCILRDLDVEEKSTQKSDEKSVDNVSSDRSQNTTSSDTEVARLELARSSPPNASVGATDLPSVEVSLPVENKTSDCSVPISNTGNPAEPKERPQIRPAPTILPRITKTSSHTLIYTSARAVGWVAFACHVISIGLSTLLTQILSVGLLVSAALLTVYRIGNDDWEVGDRLNIKKISAVDSHKDAYLYLQPTVEEQAVMRSYLLLPYQPDERDALGRWNTAWWDKWNARLGQ